MSKENGTRTILPNGSEATEEDAPLDEATHAHAETILASYPEVHLPLLSPVIQARSRLASSLSWVAICSGSLSARSSHSSALRSRSTITSPAEMIFMTESILSRNGLRT